MSHTNFNSSKRARIFISYKRNCDDEKLALEVKQALSQYHDVFIDQDMPIGMNWAKRIEQELRKSHFLISFLSATSINSEMVEGEIETAHHLGKELQGYPIILPVRVAFSESLHYPLSAYLNHINWANWNSSTDTQNLIEKLKVAIEMQGFPPDGNPSPDGSGVTSQNPPPLPSAQVEMPEGTVNSESGLYIVRSVDEIALRAIRQQDQAVTITIKGPRQVGKSSLLIRIKEAAAKANKQILYVDFQQIEKTALQNAELFFKQFCKLITRRLKIPDQLNNYWDDSLSKGIICSDYLESYILPELDKPLVLVMDEVDSLFNSSFQTDFFGMLRSWHNSRADDPEWKKLSLALVTSTEPYQFINDEFQSPFNVGEVLSPDDFTLEQVSDLNRRYGMPLSEHQTERLISLLNGHPYLVRRVLYLLANNRITVEDLFDEAKMIEERGPFGDHLRYHLFRLHDKTDLVQDFLQVIKNKTCRDEHVFFRLRGAGLVRREGRLVVPRCQLYTNYFSKNLS